MSAKLASSKAIKAEYAKDYDQAFRLYLKAAENFLHLSRSSSAPDKFKQQWKNSAAKSLERAEKIKKFSETSRATNHSSSSQGAAAPAEQFYVLKKGEKVNNLDFPLWDEPLGKNSINSTYSDPDGQPTLSSEQIKASPVWRRPDFLLSTNTIATSTHPKILPQQILQHIVTDCSVCASIAVCLEHGLRFGSSSTIHGSFESQNRTSGRYDVRVLFNGAWRRVLIDDQLPFHPTEGTMMCMSVLPLSPNSPSSRATPPTAIWPSLLEKAYMKLMGGYDFPGSNSSIDLHALAGWIPEHIDLKGSTFEREKTWERMEKGFSSGKCVVTLGTGTARDIRWRNISLLPSHSYAVIDVYETLEEGRLVTVLDSWVRQSDGQNQSSTKLQIPWAEILNTFDGVYLSWDPSMWRNSLAFHGMWKRNTGDEESTRHVQVEYNCSENPDEEIWVLLTRHIVDSHRTLDFAALRVELEDDLTAATTIAENQRTFTYTNSAHILARRRIPMSQKSGILSISVSYDGDAREVGFTVTVYAKASTKISWVESKTTPPYASSLEGSFTSKTAGGNCAYPTFMINPQYQLTIHPQAKQQSNKAKVNLDLQTNKDIPVNLAMVWSQDQRISELFETELVATSGAYNYGSARIVKTVTAGSYAVVASAFEPQYIGPFSLKVDSSLPFDLKPIPQEGAGMYCKLVRGTWDVETAAGAPSFNKYHENPIFQLAVPSTMQLKIRLQTTQTSNAIAINVTIYPVHKDVITSLTRQGHVATSGAYDDSIAGVATPQVTLGAGKYYIVPSTYNPRTIVGFRMLVYSSISGIQVDEVGKSSG
ncbi:cysteine proteinase [Pholiota conissans]|uniref:Cysteine proteinase n=1 Tax=Pholiota conissans TaxID=109636 RepID=A0A9P6CYG0_9AGAR|nr:cysteine proteinase [Pholiota conissans]